MKLPAWSRLYDLSCMGSWCWDRCWLESTWAGTLQSQKAVYWVPYFAMLVAGAMYVMISLCASELGSATKLAGGPYDWARLFIGPGAAASVGLAVYMEYIALEAADSIVVAFIAQSIFPQLQVFPVTLLVIALLTSSITEALLQPLTLNFFLTMIAFIAIVVFFFGTAFGTVNIHPEISVPGSSAEWNDRPLCSAAIWTLVLFRD